MVYETLQRSQMFMLTCQREQQKKKYKKEKRKNRKTKVSQMLKV